jgi:hypothetical protein
VIALMKALDVPLTLIEFQRLRYAGTIPEEIGPEDEADTPDEVLICDFCSGGPVTARYRAEDFIVAHMPTFIHGFLGDSAACPLCEKIIDTANWDDLLAHAVTSFYEVNPECADLPVEFVRDHLREMYVTLRSKEFKKVGLL